MPDRANIIGLDLDFDMFGSPHYVFFIYDGENSNGVGTPAGPQGSVTIEKAFEGYFTNVGQPFEGTDFTGHSDHGAFIAEALHLCVFSSGSCNLGRHSRAAV